MKRNKHWPYGVKEYEPWPTKRTDKRRIVNVLAIVGTIILSAWIGLWIARGL